MISKNTNEGTTQTSPEPKEAPLKKQYWYGMVIWILLLSISPKVSAESADYHARLSEGVTRLNENDLGGARQRFE